MKKFKIVIFTSFLLTIIYFMLNYKVYIIASGSMEPTYKINEMIVVKKTKNGDSFNERRYYNIL